MDFESNCGDADDELQMFENTPETKSATATNVSVVVVLMIGLSLLVLVVK